MMTDCTKKSCVLSDQSGMTLIEVMVASVVLLVGILGLALLQIGAINGNASARRMTEASNFTSDRLEQIMSEVWTDEVIGSDLTANDASDPDDKHTDTVNGYTAAWRVTDADDGQSKTVNLTVTWMEGERSHQVSQVAVRTIH